MNKDLFGNYYTKKFTEIYDNVDKFIADYKNQNAEFPNGIPAIISDTNATTLFYMLYAKYGNSSITNMDENQFKYKLFTIIYEYGPTWEKRLSIQARLRELTEDDILIGAKQLSQHAYNPSDEVNPNLNDGEINTTNEQTRIKYTRSILDGYANLITLLETDVTERFLAEFKKLFITVVMPSKPLWYATNIEEEEEI